MAAETVECDRCGKKVRLRADDTYAAHTYGRAKTPCEYSRTKYARHMGTFRVTQRDWDGIATEWMAACRCGLVWLGPTHAAVETPWRRHCAEIKEQRSA
jgi:hypothetical protein